MYIKNPVRRAIAAAVLASSADWLEAHRRRLETKYRRLDALLATPQPKKEPR